MKEIKVENSIIEKIKLGKVTQIILNEDLENKEKIVLKSDNDAINVEITGKSKYKSFDDCFKMIPIDLFGVSSVDEAKKIYLSDNQVIAYRIKYDSEMIEEIKDQKLLKLINVSTLKKNNVGHSSVNVYEVSLKDGTSAILKVQHLSSRNSLDDEYERINWLQGKCNVPKIFYYNVCKNTKYLLMQKMNGVSAHKTDNFAFKIGKLLRQIHEINIDDCNFTQNSVEKLLDNALKNIDMIVEQIKESYPEMNKESIIEFLKNNIPTDKVLVHGDYSLPNILIDNKGNVGVIDLGDVSISTKYFDFFYLKKSMIRNKQIDKFEELLNGYGIDKLDEKYLKWIEIVDKALF